MYSNFFAFFHFFVILFLLFFRLNRILIGWLFVIISFITIGHFLLTLLDDLLDALLVFLEVISMHLTSL